MAGLVPFYKNKLSSRPTGFEDFYNLLDDFFSDTWSPRRSISPNTFRLDVQETDKEYCVEAELPGIKKEEINIDLKDGVLSISVNREEKIEDNNKNYVHKERRYSSMQRSIYLADTNAEGVNAKLEEGILRLTVPKTDKTENRFKISID